MISYQRWHVESIYLWCQVLLILQPDQVCFVCSQLSPGVVLRIIWARYGRFTNPPGSVGKGGSSEEESEEQNPSLLT